SLDGLFLKSGPIVQTKGSNGNIVVSSDPDPGIAYAGPLIVLTSRQSASASEIFAAALQDYGRSVIVGDKNTFGKGTVQTILPIGRFTSLLGSRSDYDGVSKARYTKWSSPLFIDELRRRSGERVQHDPEFHYVMEDMERLRHKLDENRITLNEDARRKEIQDEKLRKETRTKERLARNEEEPSIYRLTLDTIDKPNLQLIMYPGKLAEAKAKAGATKVSPEAAPDDDTDTIGAADDTKEPAIDPERDETLNILADLVDLSRGPKTASTNVQNTAEQRP